MKFLIYQTERCPSTGRLHQQGFLTFSYGKSLSSAKTALGSESAHMEPARDQKRAIEYCQKLETRVAGPWRFGITPVQGKRTDRDAVVEMLLGGASISEVVRAHPRVYMQMSKGVQALHDALEKPRAHPQRKCVLLWGETATGKTRWAHETFGEELYCVLDQGKGWFDGYRGQKAALFDDAGPGMIDFNTIKRLTDRYPLRVQVKCGSVTWEPEYVIFTTNFPSWSEWWPTIRATDEAALDRRVRKFRIPHELAELDKYIDYREPVQESDTDDIITPLRRTDTEGEAVL